MIEIFLEAPLELRVILLVGVVMFAWAFVQDTKNKDNVNAKKGHK